MCQWTEDQIQLFLSTVSYILDVFKLFYGCLLSAFVSQRCSTRSDQICTLYDNFYELIPYNTFTLTFNFLTIGLLIGFYSIEYIREKWCIEYLDHEENQPTDALEHDIQRYPELLKRLTQFNRHYYYTACFSCILVSLNILFSSVLILYYYYLDYRSVTGIVTNSLLVVEKLYNSYKIAKSSTTEQCAISSYLILPIIYNQVDRDHRRPLPPILPSSPDPTIKKQNVFHVHVCGQALQRVMKVYSQRQRESM
jgi:hypothetical protein